MDFVGFYVFLQTLPRPELHKVQRLVLVFFVHSISCICSTVQQLKVLWQCFPAETLICAGAVCRQSPRCFSSYPFLKGSFRVPYPF